ncbi:MAG TPA: FliM/FliN family flagellar motor switch protein [Polyangiaceae bacterium]|nr:FliM/FliN family flagellar motor switch protein [Polyangiaceae bacterium]
MSVPEDNAMDSLFNEIPGPLEEEAPESPAPAARPRRDFTQMMRRIPVTLSLEVGSAKISLMDLASLHANSVLELDTLAGDPLVIKVNGTPIGRAEVVVSGENYGLKVLQLNDLDLDSLTS